MRDRGIIYIPVMKFWFAGGDHSDSALVRSGSPVSHAAAPAPLLKAAGASHAESDPSPGVSMAIAQERKCCCGVFLELCDRLQIVRNMCASVEKREDVMCADDSGFNNAGRLESRTIVSRASF